MVSPVLEGEIRDFCRFPEFLQIVDFIGVAGFVGIVAFAVVAVGVGAYFRRTPKDGDRP
jgi:hypothetical protein